MIKQRAGWLIVNEERIWVGDVHRYFPHESLTGPAVTIQYQEGRVDLIEFGSVEDRAVFLKALDVYNGICEEARIEARIPITSSPLIARVKAP